ncbi:MAG: glycosyltransferase family 9 protein [Chloroflexi bacterium]|nr:glycosyltransferase family 9 protein [Chloroflexota bacterium]
MLSSPRSLLILKPCCFGDVMFTTALLGVLRRAYPEARIDFAVGPHSRAAVEASPLVDTLLDTGPVGQRGYPLAAMLTLAGRIRAGDYDAIFIPDRSPALALVAFLGSHRRTERIGLNSGGRGRLHTRRIPLQGIRHEADLYLDLARAIGLPTNAAALSYAPPAAGRKAVVPLLEKANLLDKPFILIHPGGGSNPGMTLSEKRWPPPNFAGLATQLMREAGLPVVLVGGLGDDPILQAIAGLLNVPVVNFGPQPWGLIGALAERCALYVGNDTGATHMAVGAGAKVMMILGPSDPRRYAPFGPPDRVAYAWREWAVPAGGVRDGAAGFSWGAGVTVEDAFEAVMRLMAVKRNS